jgi:hypothetical protein
VRLISTAAEIPDDLLFSHEIQRWLESCPSGSGRPIRLNQDALASVVNRLANPGWRCWLEQHPDAARHVGLILQHLHHRISILDKRSNDKVHASLVARRLVLVAAWGGMPYTQEDLLSFLDNRLPPPWDPILPDESGCPPDQWASKQSAVTRFIGEVLNFWSDVPARHQKPRSDLTIREDMESRLERGIDYAIGIDQGVYIKVKGKLPPMGYPCGEDEVSISLQGPQTRAMASLAAYASQLAPSHREVLPASRVLSLIYHSRAPILESPHMEHVRDAALCGLNVLAGIEAEDLMSFGVGDQPTSGPGWIAQGQVFLRVGSGWHREMLGRVPRQVIPLPVPEWLSQLLWKMEHCDSGALRVEALYSKDPLGSFYRAAGRYAEASPHQAMFLHRPFVYAALITAAVSSAALALLLDRPVGPYRAESSYYSTSVAQLWQHATATQAVMLAWAGIPPLWTMPSDIDFKRRVGTNAPLLSEAASLALEAVRGIDSENERRAAMELGLAFHGKRPTTDKQVPCSMDGEVLAIADKNHGGGRHLRLVPQSPSFQPHPAPPWKK